MDDLISRQAVLSLPKDIVRNMSGEIIEEFVNLEDVKALPSVQPKHGKWEIKGMDGHIMCSVCGHESYYAREIYYDYKTKKRTEEIGYTPKTNFCSNCGADMRGDKDRE